MMNRITILLVLSLAWAINMSSGQPVDDMDQPRHSPERQWMPGGGPDPASPIHRWMQELKQSNPQEFERLQKLRMEDPEAFRTEARQVLQNNFMENLKNERPGVYDVMTKLSDEDRSWLIERILRPPGMPGPDRPFHGKGPGIEQSSMDENRELIRQYRRALTDEEKIAVRTKLRENLSKMYDARLQEREEQIRDAEQKLDNIRLAFEQGKQDKETFINDKLSIWLDGKPDDDQRRHGDKDNFRPGPPPDGNNGQEAY